MPGYKDKFEKEHGVKLGIMSFFVKAVVAALKKFPIVNASVNGNDIIYHGYYDIGIAVSSPRGLVVPILRNADSLSQAQIERQIADFGKRAQDGKLTIEELTGGTFSITNGGVFGSMLSTPIINPPQSAILGIHATKERPVAENGQVVIRPMCYLALSYDHRIIDGREAVLSLVAMKEALEYPMSPLLEDLKPDHTLPNPTADLFSYVPLTRQYVSILRCRRNRRWPGRVCGSDTLRPTGTQYRLYRRVEKPAREAQSGRNMSECRLHPLKGPSRVIRELRTCHP